MTNPNKNSSFIFIPLMDGEDYWNIVESMKEYRQSIDTMSGEEWEAIKNAFFGEPHQKFRDEIVINGESITPQNPDHLQKLILDNIDNMRVLILKEGIPGYFHRGLPPLFCLTPNIRHTSHIRHDYLNVKELQVCLCQH